MGTLREIIPSGRRERRINLGNQATVSGANAVALLNWQSDVDTPMVFTIVCERLSVPADEIGEADFRPYAHVCWGHGGIDMEADFEITARTRIALSCSTANIKVYVASLPLAQPGGTYNELPQTPDDVEASFRGFIATGIEADAFLPTRFQNQYGVVSGLVVGAPKSAAPIIGQQLRLTSFRAFATTTGDAFGGYLQLFDQSTAPANGDIPAVSIPLNVNVSAPTNFVAPAAADYDAPRTRGFVFGLGWAISTTPFVLTLAADTEAFVTAEFELPYPTI